MTNSQISPQRISVNYNGTEYFYLRNGQNDIVGLLDGNGTKVVEYTYDSWGKLVSTTGTLATTLGANNPFRYRGYYYDSETGLYYLQTRYYDPMVCRFISADVYMSTGQGIVGNNMFAYALNNPVNIVDSCGTLSTWEKIGIGVAILAVLVVVTIATAGTGTVLACIAAGALQGAITGAATGMAVGVVTGAVTGAVDYRLTTGSWDGAGRAAMDSAVEGAADGFLWGTIGGAIAGGLTSKVCFIAGTPVSTANGLTPIEDIRDGDYVYAEDPDTGEIEQREVVQTYRNESYELVHIFTNSENEITATPTHPFYTAKNGWIAAVDLRAGDILVTVNGERVVVEKVTRELLGSPVTVYNFEVEGLHTYFVGTDNVLVHNACIVNENGVRIDVRTSNEHGVPHAHVEGNGPNTTVGLNGQPMRGHPPLSPKQVKVIDKNMGEIITGINKYFNVMRAK